MCLIIHKPAGKDIPQWIIESAQQYNEDGVGLMHSGKAARWVKIAPNKIKKRLDRLTDKDIAIHFRMATHGEVTKDNVHPFKLANGGFLMHNGILSKYAPKQKHGDISDTRLFVQQFCNPMIGSYGSIPKAALEKELGYSNAVALMDSDGNINRYGYGWVEYEGLHFSNEYAWDYPYAFSTDRHKWTDKVVGYDSTYKGYQTIDGLVAEQLQKYQDFLPLENADNVSYEDMELYDRLFDGSLTVSDFLHECSAETCLRLYNWLVERSYVDRFMQPAASSYAYAEIGGK